jgi:hypothetical protein
MKDEAHGAAWPRALPAHLREADGRPQLYLVERHLPAITRRGLALLQAALSEASRRFASRGHEIAYLGSTFVPSQGRLLSLFTAERIELVKSVNEAAVAPFLSIEVAVALDDSDAGTTV